MYLVVGGLLLLLVVTASTSTAVRLHASAVSRVLTDTLRPAQMESANLTKAYIDEETGERGYLLTRDDSFLQPYDNGRQAAVRAHTALADEFAGDPVSLGMLSQVDAAADAWHTRALDPELSAARHGTLTGPVLLASVTLGRELFDALRSGLSTLQEHINQLVGITLQGYNQAQTTANDVTVVAAVAAVLLAAVAIWQLRTSFARPLNRLVTQVRRVSDGDLDQSVDVGGPLEITTVARTVEAMRTRILAENARSEATARQLARYEEADRIARSLGDTVIRQLYTTSLALQSTASRYPATAPALTSAIREIDAALRDLQTAIFELTAGPNRQPLGEQLLDLVDQIELGLGAAPEVQLAGSLDADVLQTVAADVITVVHDLVTEVIRPAAGGSTISLSADDAELRLRVTGDVTGSHGNGSDTALADAREVAERLGGSCAVSRDGDALDVDWRIPVPALESGHQ